MQRIILCIKVYYFILMVTMFVRNTFAIYTLENVTNFIIYPLVITNNWSQFLIYLGTTHLWSLTVTFSQKRKQIKIFSISPYIEHAMLAKFKTFWKCNFSLKLSWEVVFRIEGIAFIFIAYSFYFNYFYFILLLQKIVTNCWKVCVCVCMGGWVGVGGCGCVCVCI